jgi:hypothetical protein
MPELGILAGQSAYVFDKVDRCAGPNKWVSMRLTRFPPVSTKSPDSR